MPVTVDYYITLNSPFTYLGCALLAEIAQRNNATVNINLALFSNRQVGCRCRSARRNAVRTE